MAATPNALSLASPETLQLYRQLLARIEPIGPFREEVKKTSIHLVRASAFLGVHTRKQHLLITIKADNAVKSPRIAKAEQVSKSRWHLDMKLAGADDIDKEFLGWVRQAYALCQ